MRRSFWQKDSLITHLLFELQPINIFSPVANFGDQYLIFCRLQKNIELKFFLELTTNRLCGHSQISMFGLHFNKYIVVQHWELKCVKLWCFIFFVTDVAHS